MMQGRAIDLDNRRTVECHSDGDNIVLVFVRFVEDGDEVIPFDNDGPTPHTQAQYRDGFRVFTVVKLSREAAAAALHLLGEALAGRLFDIDPDAATGCADDDVPRAQVDVMRELLESDESYEASAALLKRGAE